MSVQDKYQKVAELLKSSKNTVVLTGAGMSTESGLKDFRGADGLWKGKNPAKIGHVSALRWDGGSQESWDKLREFHEFYQWRIRELMKHTPHVGHRILAEWQKEGLIHQVITQNVDEFHTKAGSENVIELHGRLLDTQLHVSGEKVPLHSYLTVSHPETHDHDVMRPGVVLFGEPIRCLEEAKQAADKAELILILGSSMTVSPANELPIRSLAKGGQVVQINNDPTPYSQVAGVDINEVSIGTALREIRNLLNPTD